MWLQKLKISFLTRKNFFVDFTLYGELLHYNLGTDYQTLKETYNLAINKFIEKTNFVFKNQQHQLERLEDNICDEVRSHSQFLLQCFGYEAYQTFLKDRHTEDKRRKLQEVEELAASKIPVN